MRSATCGAYGARLRSSSAHAPVVSPLREFDRDDGPRKRALEAGNGAVLGDEVPKSPRRPVVDVARRVAELAHVSPGQQMECAPQWFAWDAQEKSTTGDSGHLVQSVSRTLDMLEDLERAHAVERPVVERQLVRRRRSEREQAGGLRCHSARSVSSPRSTPTVVTPVRVARRSVTMPSPHPTSRIELGRSESIDASISRRKRLRSVRVTGFPLAYLSVALPDGPTKSAASTVSPALSGEPLRPSAPSALARRDAPRAVT